MKRIRITGIVRDANHVRQALQQPMTARESEQLYQHAQRSVRIINDLLREHNASAAHLPPQSRRAYEFLASFRPQQATITENASRPPLAEPRETVSFKGLQAFLERVLDNIALNAGEESFKFDATREVIEKTAQRSTDQLDTSGVSLNELTQASRNVLAWFSYFRHPDNLQVYVEATADLLQAFDGLPVEQFRWHRPLLVHFKPVSCLYRWRVIREGTRVILNTPFVAFDRSQMRTLAQRVLGDKRCERAVNSAMLDEPYQNLQLEIAELTDPEPVTSGVHHDLARSFERVNRAYFEGRMAQPRLEWTAQITARIFGHYNHIHDRLTISRSLDSPDVPAFVLDHVMHHELLHKKHGVRWQGHRREVHTPEFRSEERTFDRYSEADAFLNELSARLFGRR